MIKKISWWQVIALLVIICGTALIIWSAEQQDENLRRELLLNTRLAATGISADEISNLTGSATDLSLPEYLEVKKKLGDIHRADPHARFVYLLGQRQDGTIFFHADSEPPESEDYSPPGEVYHEASDSLYHVFTTGNEDDEGPESDRWGTWVSGFVPILDPATGNVIAVLGIDIDAKAWILIVISNILPILIATSLVLLILLISTMFQQRIDNERRRIGLSEESLRISEERFRSFVENANDIVYSLTQEGILIYISPNWKEVLGHEPAEVTGQPIDMFIHPEDLQKYHIFFKQVIETGKKQEGIEYRIQHKTGQWRWHTTNASPIHDSSGTIISCLGIARDITKRKKAEQALQESETKYREFFTTSRDCVFITQPDGRWIDFNDVALELFGFDSRAELFNVPIPLLYRDPDERKFLLSTIEQQGFVKEYPVQFKRKDETIIDTLVTTVRLLNQDGITKAYIGTIRDITEQKKAEKALRKVLEERETLLKEIHHRVKNNIQVISSLLNIQSRTTNNVQVKEILRDAQNRIKSIAMVHEQLYRTKELDKIDYGTYLAGIIKSMSVAYGLNPTDIEIMVSAEQVFLNMDQAVPCSLIINEMITNSFKHAFPERGKGKIWIDIKTDGGDIILQYRDNGIGITDNSLMERTGSLGMQLIMGLTMQLQGTIEMDTQMGSGYILKFPHKTRDEGGT